MYFFLQCDLDTLATEWWGLCLFPTNLVGSLQLLQTIKYVVNCCNKVRRLGWLRNNRNLLLTDLEVGSPRSGSGSGKDPRLGFKLPSSCCVLI